LFDYIFFFFACDAMDLIVRLSRHDKSTEEDEEEEVEDSLLVKENFLLTMSISFLNLAICWPAIDEHGVGVPFFMAIPEIAFFSWTSRDTHCSTSSSSDTKRDMFKLT